MSFDAGHGDGTGDRVRKRDRFRCGTDTDCCFGSGGRTGRRGNSTPVATVHFRQPGYEHGSHDRSLLRYTARQPGQSSPDRAAQLSTILTVFFARRQLQRVYLGIWPPLSTSLMVPLCSATGIVRSVPARSVFQGWLHGGRCGHQGLLPCSCLCEIARHQGTDKHA